MITRIEEEIARIDRLVGELLTLSRLETGEMPPVNEEVDMHDLVRDVVHDANFEAQPAALYRSLTRTWSLLFSPAAWNFATRAAF
jgi:signal transduction histidine kinase